jgi:hypothetical protein
MAVNIVYPGFTAGSIPSSDYDNIALPAIERHMMLGGARLANLIGIIYSANELFLQ